MREKGKDSVVFPMLFGKGKSIIIALAALIIGIALMLFGGKKESEPTYDKADTSELEQRVEKLCSQVEGVGAVSVMITADTVSEKIYARNSQTGSEYSKSEYVTVSGGLMPIGERTMTVRGVAVVCGGGDSDTVKLKLTELICALFNIGADRVSIVGGN